MSSCGFSRADLEYRRFVTLLLARCTSRLVTPKCRNRRVKPLEVFIGAILARMARFSFAPNMAGTADHYLGTEGARLIYGFLAILIGFESWIIGRSELRRQRLGTARNPATMDNFRFAMIKRQGTGVLQTVPLPHCTAGFQPAVLPASSRQGLDIQRDIETGSAPPPENQRLGLNASCHWPGNATQVGNLRHSRLEACGTKRPLPQTRSVLECVRPFCLRGAPKRRSGATAAAAFEHTRKPALHRERRLPLSPPLSIPHPS